MWLAPWVAVVVIALAVLSMSRYADDRHAAMVAHPSTFQPCPQCHLDGALVDTDGVALCTTCGCSYEVVSL